jgi:toxin ParE1/3/4
VRELVYLTAARDDLSDILRHIAEESGSLAVAQAFVGKLMDHCERLAALPGPLGTARPELRPDIRSIPHQSYVIFFRYVGACLEIVNVLSANRDVARYFEH